MSKFKVGDKVRCIDASDHPAPLQMNKAYYVSYVGGPFGNLRVRGVEERYSYKQVRFEKVLPNPRKL